MSRPTLILTVGLPYSGKSTWARKQGLPIVCPDEIRLALHGQRFEPKSEPFVWAIAKVMVRSLFGAGHDRVILDACNSTPHRREEWADGAWDTEIKLFNVSSATCIDRATEAGDATIIPVIKRMASRFQPDLAQ